MTLKDTNVGALHAQAVRCYQAGDRAQAERLCWEILQREPLHADAIHLLGALALHARELARAILHFHHATLLRPDHATYQHALAEAYRAAGREGEAIACYHDALRLDPACAATHHGLGYTLMTQGNLDEAVASLRQSLALQPRQPRAQNNLGQALHRCGDLTGAAACFTEALRLQPDYAIAHNNLGATLQAQGQLAAAAAHFQQALALMPDYPEAHFNQGSVLQARGEAARAAACFREALRLRPDYPRAQLGLGQVLEAFCDFPAALACYRRAVDLQPDFVEAYLSLGNLLVMQPDWDGARAAFERVLELQPANADAFGNLFVIRQLQCDWRDRDQDLVRLWHDAASQLTAGQPTALRPFNTLWLPCLPEQQHAVARSHSDAYARQAEAQREALGIVAVGRIGNPSHEPRLRIGYLSAEFRDHAVSHLVQGIFGLHDRRSFEVFAYSFGPDDRSTYRQRIERNCDHFRDLRDASLADSARCIIADRLHILIDLQGYIGVPRMALLAMRLTPLQVHYLGYPGTCGAGFIDYLIGDPIVTPPERHTGYREKVVLLPHCYLATDNGQPVATSAGSRADHGLPQHGTVFCAFNHSYKIEPERFSVWMRILQRVPDSVLWLSPAARKLESNLRREAEARSVAADRLVFARRMADKADHLARHRLADLFLDTAHYNGHTTACDALWAGLPVLTCPGETFASRVGASLLTNVGLPGLIASDPHDYEEIAIRLASQPGELRQLRARLAANRASCPLFDTPRLTANLERAYRLMWDRHCTGEPPWPITVNESGR